ncbi:MAG: alginate export family protein [Deltaproteobacteria bacterium]|nr:alginate export family protein [Deltaproteobacteria bacterium]
MLKKISVLALTGLLALPVSALAAAPTVQDLEQKMMEMTHNFNAQMQAMQKEISALKTKNADISKDVADVKSVAGTTGAADWTKKISLGGQVRLRGYDLQNVWNFDNSKDWDHWNVFRLKSSLKATVKATKDVTAVVQMTDQTYGEGVGVDSSGEGDNRDNKIFLDNAYINARNMFGLPVDLTLGRQNLIYGSGFVVLDGQSQFASTSIYFDGVKLRWHATKKTSVDLLYMKDQEGNRDNASNDDITLSGAYLISKQCSLIGKSEAYILNRNDEGKKKSIWMYGLRLSDKLANGIDYSAEGAIQRGDASATQGQDAYGYKLNAGYTFKNAAMTPRLYLGYAFMSGDDTSTTGDNEGWDVFYGGWPQFGDLLVWEYVNIGAGNALNGVYNYNKLSSTGGEAVYSNFGIATLGASVNLLKNLNANLSYSKVTFDKVAAGMSDDFGDYYQAKLKYKYNKQLSFSLYGAIMAPGDAFNATPKDNATELYWESDFRF